MCRIELTAYLNIFGQNSIFTLKTKRRDFCSSLKEEKEKEKKENFVLLEGHSQTLLEVTCPPHFCMFFFILCLFWFLFFCCDCTFFEIKYIRKIHI